MKFKKIKNLFYEFIGRIIVPEELVNRNYEILVHLSDTPTAIYGELRAFLKELKPEYIIHTGDLVDNIKLELYPKKIDLYEKFIKVIVNIINQNAIKKSWIVMGNHDNYQKIDLPDNMELILDSDLIDVENGSFSVSHYALKCREYRSDYHLFGHDLMVDTQEYHGEYYLNGIEHIHIINLSTGEILFIDYPKDTNDYRLNKYKIGI